MTILRGPRRATRARRRRWPLSRPVSDRYADAYDPPAALAATIVAVVLLLVAGMVLAVAGLALWLNPPDEPLFWAAVLVAGTFAAFGVLAAAWRFHAIDGPPR